MAEAVAQTGTNVTATGTDQRDVEACLAVLREGSKSFHAASLLLPARIRGPVAATYAFCRVADDAVDEAADPRMGLETMRARLDGIYDGSPADDAVDRAMAHVVTAYGLPREVIEALLEGFAWDVEGRRYQTFSELTAYCARVASTVGVLMTVLMGERRERVLRRACDLGVAMQLTNIARDVGEDAREGRLYLPMEWMREVGLEPESFLEDVRFTPPIGLMVKRLLGEAEPLYRRADQGIALLPRDCRMAIKAARLIYADIGRAIVANGYDTVSHRAYTGAPRKAWLLLRSMPIIASGTPDPSEAPALEETRFLVEAAAA